MKDFSGRIAVITGAGSGMGRELAVQLAREGCHLGLCDVSMENLEETRELAGKAGTDIRVSIHRCDVGSEPGGADVPRRGAWPPTTPATCICCSTTPASAAAGAFWPIRARSGSAR